MQLEELITELYVCVDDKIEDILKGKKIRRRGYKPALSDSEVISMELIGEYLSIDTTKGIWCYFKTHWQGLFPRIGSRSQFDKQSSNTFGLKRELLKRLQLEAQATSRFYGIVDGYPIPVCKFGRAHFCKKFNLAEQASYGYCAAKKEKYYGFKGMIGIDRRGIILGETLVPANIDEREAIFDLIEKLPSLTLGDKGFIGKEFQNYFSQSGKTIVTTMRSNMKAQFNKATQSWITRHRRLVETVIGQLTERFKMNKVWARDSWHLGVRMTRKLIAHTLMVNINLKLNRQPLDFDGILTP
ncbi:MAG: IS982 family transposase [Proteobacteria bacterium]|nr:IS982 family transposase [Pseudomonadota bacterium]